MAKRYIVFQHFNCIAIFFNDSDERPMKGKKRLARTESQKIKSSKKGNTQSIHSVFLHLILLHNNCNNIFISLLKWEKTKLLMQSVLHVTLDENGGICGADRSC